MQVTQNGDMDYFDQYKLRYNALPEVDFEQIDLQTQFLDYQLAFPFLVSSMSGGVEQGNELNLQIAEACNEARVAFASGSIRVALGDPDLLGAFDLKDKLADVPYLINIGAFQLKDKKIQKSLVSAIKELRVDGVFIHLNPLQEVVQEDGDTDWRGVKSAIADFVQVASVPVFVKEVGHGLSTEVIEELSEWGVVGFDVSGLGGLSWGHVEADLQNEPELANVVRNIGYETPWLVKEAYATNAEWLLIAGGGVRSGIDILKSMILGASMATAALPIKMAAADGKEGVLKLLNHWKQQLQVGLFALGQKDLSKVRGNSDLLF